MKMPRRALMKNKLALSAVLFCAVFAVAVFAGLKTLRAQTAAATVPGKWYSAEQVALGEDVFNAHCLSCHGVRARGAENWRKPLASGAYPPPPLDGSAHTWHHSLAQLRRSVENGGAAFGGQMPPFGEVLSEEERDAVIAYFQSLWPGRVYEIWSEKINRRK